MAQGIVGEYLALKRDAEADLLAMQLGDFYEFFAEDAETVGEELDLKTSKKSSGGTTYPMAGVPVDELTPYLKTLVERGYRVAVADQFETDDGHERRVTRVATPGTLLESTDDDARFLAAVVAAPDADDWAASAEAGSRPTSNADPGAQRGDADGADAAYGLALADVTTGQFLVTTAPDAAAAAAELYRFDPVELLPGPTLRNDDGFLAAVRDGTDATLSVHDAEAFAPGRARHAVREQFGEGALDSVGLEDGVTVRAAGGILGYVAETGVGVAASMTRLRTYDATDHVDLDATTQRNLEVVETMQGDAEGSLFDTVDHTVTSAGGRRLRQWLTRPRRDRETLARRLDAVEDLAAAALAREAIRDRLGDAYDLARLASRAASGSAGPRELARVRETLGLVPELRETASTGELADGPVPAVLERPDTDAAATLREELEAALAEDPPATPGDETLVRRGYDDELDGVIEEYEAAREWLDTLADREKDRHGLRHVTVDRNKTDGYYIQVGKSSADDVPDHYRHVKTLKNSKRFTTDELQEREREILRLEERRAELERAVVEEVRERVAADAELLQDVGRALAEVDAFASLATHAVEADWARPTLTEEDVLDVEAGRHPVVERTTEFVPNDLHLDGDRRFLLVTGPNMSGKSTYMRQAALITLLAQAGSFVPARAATVGLVDGIYTRVGALDELAQGRSTFMVEMQELSNILHSATDDSLVILDEVGRGTATYDGISIAWAATEYLSGAQANTPSPKTLFATHYHELTELADHIDGVANVHVAADERDGDVTFLRTVREGAADRSYGIHVAELAGVPDPVVSRARTVLRKLREEEAIDVLGSGGGGSGSGSGSGDDTGETQQVVFDLGSGQFRGAASADGGAQTRTPAGDAAADPGADREAGTDGLDPAARAVLEEVSEMDVTETSPVDLMRRVQEWQDRLEE
jgi:DNA mismatch repair protein MutS